MQRYSINFLPGSQKFRNAIGLPNCQADFDGKVRCEIPLLYLTGLARDNSVYPSVIAPAARYPQSAL